MFDVTVGLNGVEGVTFTLRVPFVSKFLLWVLLNEDYGLDLDRPADFTVLAARAA